ncbi:DUF4041 domain-containing protein [Staphylococcus simulans]|nr:DUF4041 domain-containing protein [Staphylococcus simulans]
MYPIDFDNESSSEIKNKLSLLTIKEKKLSDINNLISYDDINNKNHVKNQKKQLIRMFDTECKYYFTQVKAKNYDQIVTKITKSFESLNRLFKTDNVHLTDKHLQIKLEKLYLIHKYALKLEEEKELRKEEKAFLREQLAAERELEQKRKLIEKDEKHFNNEISKLMKYMQDSQQNVEKQLYIEKIKELESKLKEVEKSKENIEYKIAHAKAGYVYIISNIGSFGENIYKIGVTRRENPLDRIKDLGDASVPFQFDVHAIIFSEDAFKLEKKLHDYFRKYEVNKVNHRKEFFRVDINEIKELVLKEYNNTVNFEIEAKAEQFRESLRITNQLSKDEEDIA